MLVEYSESRLNKAMTGYFQNFTSQVNGRLNVKANAGVL